MIVGRLYSISSSFHSPRLDFISITILKASRICSSKRSISLISFRALLIASSNTTINFASVMAMDLAHKRLSARVTFLRKSQICLSVSLTFHRGGLSFPLLFALFRGRSALVTTFPSPTRPVLPYMYCQRFSNTVNSPSKLRSFSLSRLLSSIGNPVCNAEFMPGRSPWPATSW